MVGSFFRICCVISSNFMILFKFLCFWCLFCLRCFHKKLLVAFFYKYYNIVINIVVVCYSVGGWTWVGWRVGGRVAGHVAGCRLLCRPRHAESASLCCTPPTATLDMHSIIYILHSIVYIIDIMHSALHYLHNKFTLYSVLLYMQLSCNILQLVLQLNSSSYIVHTTFQYSFHHNNLNFQTIIPI